MPTEPEAHGMAPNPQIIAVLGPPGAGKGTQCALLQSNFHCAHISIGDLLRAETTKLDSPYRDIITENIKLGRIGPKEMTVGILKKELDDVAAHDAKVILLDGFPRKWDSAVYFEEIVAPISLVLVLECPEEVLVEWLLERKRGDDDVETIKARVNTFETTTAEVLEKYTEMGKVVRVKADSSREDVFARVQAALENANIKLGA